MESWVVTPGERLLSRCTDEHHHVHVLRRMERRTRMGSGLKRPGSEYLERGSTWIKYGMFVFPVRQPFASFMIPSKMGYNVIITRYYEQLRSFERIEIQLSNLGDSFSLPDQGRIYDLLQRNSSTTNDVFETTTTIRSSLRRCKSVKSAVFKASDRVGNYSRYDRRRIIMTLGRTRCIFKAWVGKEENSS